jgi:hypothetical protein
MISYRDSHMWATSRKILAWADTLTLFAYLSWPAISKFLLRDPSRAPTLLMRLFDAPGYPIVEEALKLAQASPGDLVHLDPEGRTVPFIGQETIAPTSTIDHTLTIAGPWGSASSKVTIHVSD